MRQQTSFWRLTAASVWLLALAAAVSAQTFDLRLRNKDTGAETLHTDPLPAPQGTLPVLFVHGHNPLNPTDADFNYRQNWQTGLNGLPSFVETLGLADNNWLDIEEYYIRFETQGRSIAEDAREIGEAVEFILRRHNSTYPAQPPAVQVVIIAYSKGTISTRLYLKSLQEDVAGLPPHRDGFRPVSEFIAIAPPNHGLSTGIGITCSIQQLMNGRDPGCDTFGIRRDCGLFPRGGLDFITNLNIVNGVANEAPGSRPDTHPDTGARNPPTDGTLYVTIFADNNRDFVGGDQNPDGCGRRQAKNLSPDAINIPLASISGNDETAVHQNTVHTPEVICLALYAAVHHRSPKGVTCKTEGNLPVIPRAAAMLALDFSGSMSAPACSTCPSTTTRAVVLKQAVELFVQLWSALGLPSDRLGVTYFRINVEQFNRAGETIPFISDAANDLITNVHGQTPRNLTAMGGGLQQSITTLLEVPYTPVRRVILFTDGMQNVNPMVQTVDSQLVIADRPSPPAVPLTVLNTSLGIAVDTIGIGAGEAFVGPLEEIADRTGGHSKTTIDMDLLRQFFVEELINALRGFSPQLVAYRRGAVAPKGSTESFVIEDGVRKLVLKVSWKNGDSLDFSVVRDGVDVTSAGRFINGAFYKIFVIDLPAKGQIAARGNWQLRINGKATTQYEAAAIVDGGKVAYDAMFDVKRPRAGDPLDLVVRLTAGGQPISGNVKVTVTLMSPTTAAGDIIATTQPKELPSFEPGMTVAERQLLSLTLDPKRLAGLKPRHQKLIMQPNDKGEFRTRLSPQVPGIYTAFVTIEGEDPKLGQFSRTLTTTTMVRFANADLKASDIFTSECRDGGRRYVRLVLSPRDARGQRMGPGLSSVISLSLSAGRTVGNTRDLGDGSYMMLLAVAPGDDPTVKLEVAGATLFSGKLSQLTEKLGR